LLNTTLLLVFVGAASCGGVIIGDPSHVVYLHNTSDGAVLVYEVSGTDRVFDARVAAGATKEVGWLISRTSPRKRTVEAFDEAGVLVFCQSYSYDELEGIAWRIEIVSGQNACGSLTRQDSRPMVAHHHQ